MQKSLFSLLFSLAAGLCCAQQPSESGEQREWLPSFGAVEVSAAADVVFVQVPDSVAPRIVYDLKGATDTRFRAEVRDQVLRISERIDARRADRTAVRVYYNALERISIAAAAATFEGGFHAPLLDLEVGGGAQMTTALEVGDLRMELTGKSTATLTGAVRYLSLFVSAGKVEASELETMSAEVNVTASGSASLWITDRFVGKTSTGGKIAYKGAPSLVRGGTKFLGGDIIRAR